jgi:hypothetical protein
MKGDRSFAMNVLAVPDLLKAERPNVPHPRNHKKTILNSTFYPKMPC